MKCPNDTEETSEILLAYSAGRLDPEAVAAVERHLASCPACRETFEEQRAVWEALDGWDAAAVAPDFDRRLYGRIEREASGARWWRIAPAGPALVRRWLPFAAAAGLLLAAGGLLDYGTPSEAREARFEFIRADQVERTLEDLELLHAFTTEVRAQAQPANPL
jgi:anti-sigma factor RsiW